MSSEVSSSFAKALRQSHQVGVLSSEVKVPASMSGATPALRVLALTFQSRFGFAVYSHFTAYGEKENKG